MGKTINTILNLQDKFSDKLDKAGKNALTFKDKLKTCERAAKDTDKFLNKMSKTAVAASAAGAAAMGAFAASAVKTYGEFQQSMSNVAGISGITTVSEDYKKLEAAAREAGKSTTKTAAESADALSYMALAGWTTEQQLKGLMPILRASEATGADLAVTSDLVTDSMSAMGVGVERLTEYLDMAAAANNKSNQNMLQLMEAIIGSGGAARAAGVNMYDLSTALGVLADNGLKGAEGGTAMNSMLVRMTTHNKALKTMKSLGVEVFDANKKFRGLEAILTDLNAAMAGMGDEDITANLKAIAGTNYYSQFKYLLDAAKEGSAKTDEFSTRWKEFNSELHNSKGTLDTVADTMTDNYAGAMARAGSAMDDLKITIGQKLEPYITKFLNWFSEKLPGATEKFASWLDRKLPKAIEFCKKAFEKIKPVVSFIINNFKSLASVAAGVIVGLKAFSVITKVVSWYKKLQAAGSALKAVQLALNASMLACPLTWIATAIGTVVGGFLLYKSVIDKIEEADVAAHFGDIALSVEECGRMAQNVFGTDLVNKANELNSAWDRVDSHFRSLSDSAMELNKLTFQIEMNPKNVSQDEYVEAAKKYIEDMQTAIKGKQYELVLDINFLFGEGSSTADLLNGQTSKYWSGVLQNAQNLGDELVANIVKGYENGWDEKSMEMVAKSLQKMSEIQEKIQMAQAQSRMELLTADFKMSDLSQESFGAYIEKLNEQAEVIKEASNTAASNAMAAQKLMLDEGAITQEQYDTNKKSITAAYEKQSAEALNTALSEGMRAIKEVYPKEFEAVAKQLNDDLMGEFVIDPENLNDSMLVLQNVISESFKNSGVSSGVKKDIQGYLETLMPTAGELKKMAAKDQSLWKVYGDTLTSVEVLKSLTGSGDQAGNALISGINSSGNLMNAGKAAQELKDRAIKVFSEKVKIEVPIEIKYGTAVPTYGPTQYTEGRTSIFSEKATEEAKSRQKKDNQKNSLSYAGSTGYGQLGRAMNSIGGHATGTSYFGGGLTEINEHGGEVINLPTGAQIIPSDKSAQMVKENAKSRMPNISFFNIPSFSFKDTPYFGRKTESAENKISTVLYSSAANNESNEKSFGDININVNIEGNIIGLDNAADEIGGRVCEQIVDMVRSM